MLCCKCDFIQNADDFSIMFNVLDHLKKWEKFVWNVSDTWQKKEEKNKKKRRKW
jgi:radical SAM superfamily enzyme YgiQ (UPF0313 family)